ncbi:MAG TPA: hypothetical protein PKE55_08200 [Kiritimatiellia bacterium]|nr:hypothetical protein [Kiritimatiellia bacterium]
MILLQILIGSLIIGVAHGHDRGSPSRRDPGMVLDEALTRIFVGSTTEAPTGDLRSLQLSASEHALANHAGRMFNTLEYASGYGFPDAEIYDPDDAESAKIKRNRLRKVLAAHAGKERLTELERKQLLAVVAPFVRRIAIDAQLSSGILIVPPGTKCRLRLTSYCMDKDWPSPRQGEKMQLVPVQTLLPGNLGVLYSSLLGGAASDASTRAQLQGLIWTLRQIAQDPKGEKVVSLSQRQREILETAHPNGYAYFQMLRQPLGRSSLPAELERLVRQEVADAVGGLGDSGYFETRIIPDEQIEHAVEQQLERIASMPVTTEIPNNNSHYTKLAEGVFARSVYGSLDIQIANSTKKAFLFEPQKYVAQSERSVQRMGFKIAKLPVSGSFIQDIPIGQPQDENRRLDRVIFVNGVRTPRDRAYCIAEKLHHELKVPVTLAYNDEKSIAIDFIAALYDDVDDYFGFNVTLPGIAILSPSPREYKSPNSIVAKLIPYILNCIDNGERVGLLGHSEGTIIINEVGQALDYASRGITSIYTPYQKKWYSKEDFMNFPRESLRVVLAGGEYLGHSLKKFIGSGIEIQHKNDPVSGFMVNKRDIPKVWTDWHWHGIYNLAASFSENDQEAEVMSYMAQHLKRGFSMKYHSFTSIYFKYITQNIFFMKGPPLEIANEPTDDFCRTQDGG